MLSVSLEDGGETRVNSKLVAPVHALMSAADSGLTKSTHSRSLCSGTNMDRPDLIALLKWSVRRLKSVADRLGWSVVTETLVSLVELLCCLVAVE